MAIANRFGGCFCLGSGPVFCDLVCFRLFASLFPLAKRKSGWGMRVVVFECGCVFRLLFYRFAYSKDFFVLVQCFACLLTCQDRAISATSATREKKNGVKSSSSEEGSSTASPAFSGSGLLPARGCSCSSGALRRRVSRRCASK